MAQVRNILEDINKIDDIETTVSQLQTDAGNSNIHIANTSNPHSVTKTQVGLSNVDNTSDANKPVSTATQTALNLKAPLASPTFTGTVSGITKTMVGLGNVENKSSATIRGEITSSNVTTALGYTPYNSTNPSGYIAGITSGMVTTALGFTPLSTTGTAADSDKLDGQHGSYYQPASTAITTSNIGSQSVSYASSAGNADTLDGNHASAFQSTLISGTNIKTVGGNSLLGSGDISVGKVLQIKSTTVTGKVSASGTTDTGLGTDLGLNVSITPLSSSSKFYITVHIGVGSTTSGNSWGGILSRNGVKVGNGPELASRPGMWFKSIDHGGSSGTDTNHGVGASASYYDTVSGTAGVTRNYLCGFAGEGGSVHINAVESDYSGAVPVVHSQTQSTITVMEIGA